MCERKIGKRIERSIGFVMACILLVTSTSIIALVQQVDKGAVIIAAMGALFYIALQGLFYFVLGWE